MGGRKFRLRYACLIVLIIMLLVIKSNSTSWANANAGTTVDAGIGINYSFSIRKSDRSSRAGTFTGTASNAQIIINFCSHENPPFFFSTAATIIVKGRMQHKDL